ncbi:MAG: hypothetical protein M3P24_02265, partial [Gemmatimonadota bacterium]|nr:hypothetical protein [Gemmatimonadota bacterium]
LTRITDPDGLPALVARYDGARRMTTRWDRNGSGWGFTYDAAGKLASSTMPQVTADGQPVRPEERFRSWEAALLPAPERGSFPSPAPRVAPEGARAEITDPKGNTTRVRLDRWMSPVQVEAPLGGVSRVVRNAQGQVEREIAPSGDSTSYTWQGVHLTRVQNHTTGRTVNLRYGPYAEVDSIWGDITPVRHFLNAQGLPDSTRVGASPKVTKYRYDGRGRDTLVVDPEGHATRLYYGASGFQNADSVKVGSRRTAYAYDGYGRLVSTKTPEDHVSSTEYDLLNRVTQSVNAKSGVTSYTYDALFLYRVIDPKGQFYHFHHNALGWLESEVDPKSQWTYYRYDRNGNLVERVNRRSQTLRFSYDELDRVKTRTDAVTGKSTSYAYDDPKGLWLAVQNEESSDTLRFDPAGRITQEITARGGTRYALESNYDVRDLRTQLRLTSPWTRSIGYRYNAQMQLDTLIDLAGGRTRIGYNADRQPTSVTLPTGLDIVRNYPSTHVAFKIEYSAGGTTSALEPYLGRNYSHNKRGLIETRYNAAGDTARTYSYDEIVRLTGYLDEKITPPEPCNSTGEIVSADGTVCNPSTTRETIGGEGYKYDAVGNPDPAQTGVVVETGNRLTSFQGYTLEYDADGNLTRKTKRDSNGNVLFDQTLVWNNVGEMESVTTSGRGTVRYGYDGLGRRIRRTLPSGEVIQYVYDGEDLFLEHSSSGARTEYTYYPGIDRPHSVTRNGATYYYASELPGHITGLIDGSNALVNEYRYKPFGMPEAGFPKEQVPNSLRFMAREIDAEAGLYYIRNRWYDPELARFVSEDPIGLEGGINPYAFAANNPVNFTDPLGLDPCENYGLQAVEQSGSWGNCGISSGGGGGAWPFSTGRESGASSKFGKRGPGAGIFAGGSSKGSR